MSENHDDGPGGLVAAVAKLFLTGPASLLVIMLAAFLGTVAVLRTPREEEPQIVVPLANLLVEFPGHSATEVEQLVTTRLERLAWQIEGVEHVYSTSRRDQAMVTVRFEVGRDRDRAMVKLRDQIQANQDQIPPGVVGWLVKPVEIDDVPIVTLTLYAPVGEEAALRRVAEELRVRLENVRNISRTEILGGRRRLVQVYVHSAALAARGIGLGELVEALRRSNNVVTAGHLVEDGQALRVLVGPGLDSVEAVAATVLIDRDGLPVRLADVATVEDGEEEPENYVHIGFGPLAAAGSEWQGRRLAAVTLAFSKKRGTNAVRVAQEIVAAAEQMREQLLSSGIRMQVTRNYGELADTKVDGLLQNLFFAVLTVVGVIALTMGWREGLVVGLAVPVSFALALFTNYVFGYTINRVTLFALILSLGLVVDDPITNVDNIQRHIRRGLEPPARATLRAVQEMGPAVIMSTLAIVVCFLPMFFITGMMGPYMRPMAINVPVTVCFSTVCALTFVPWLAYRLLKHLAPTGDGVVSGDVEGVETTPAWVRRSYRAMLGPFMRRRNALLLFAGVLALLAISGLLVVVRAVPLKMLPFDNKDELQLIVDLPEGTALEQTDAVVQEIEAYLVTVNEVKDFQCYTGLNSPLDFNGLVRSYGMRREPHQADIRVNLGPRARRRMQSHDVALRLRDPLTAVAARHGALLKIVEMPPGPPVMATLVVEVRGRPDQDYAELIAAGRELQEKLAAVDARHIVEIDDSTVGDHPRLIFDLRRDKAAFHGLTVAEVGASLRAALAGVSPGFVHLEDERNPLLILVRLPLADRASPERLGQLWIGTRTGSVQLAELGDFRFEPVEQPIQHKNMERVVYVTADVVGRPPGEAIWEMFWFLRQNPLPEGIRLAWAGEGEWEITVRVFRDLGLAFAAALFGIYLLLILQMRSFTMPLLVLAAIPLTAIGVMPGFWLLNLLLGSRVGGYPSPVYFTATAMIGMIALGGIVIRNSLVLIEFIQESQKAGLATDEAILESGAVRFRPIMLTAATTMLGALPITFDPIFSGLAWALIFGLLASTLFTLVVVPAAYKLLGPKVGEPG